MLLKSFIITIICFYLDCDTSDKTAIFHLYYNYNIDVREHRCTVENVGNDVV